MIGNIGKFFPIFLIFFRYHDIDTPGLVLVAEGDLANVVRYRANKSLYKHDFNPEPIIQCWVVHLGLQVGLVGTTLGPLVPLMMKTLVG